jgi:hypothetical protein
MGMGRVVIDSRLSDTRVMTGHKAWLFLFIISCHIRGYVYLLCICKAQGEFITVDGELHRITHRSIFLEFHDCSRDKSHVEEVLTK